jgi:general secretion pathway protein F
MPVFSYQATSFDGELTEGVIDAPEAAAAIERLKISGVIPLKVSALRGKKQRRRLFRSAQDLLGFTGELSALLAAGLPLDRSLNILSGISEGRVMRDVVEAVLKSIRGGSSFSDALQKHPQVFPPLYVSMVRAGEAGGVLDAVLEKLNEFQESTQELKDHLFTAMIYPAILLLTGTMSIIVLLTFVLPRFSVIFNELGTALPVPTRILLSVSNDLKEYWLVFLSSCVFLWFVLRQYVRSENGKRRLDGIKLKLMGDVIRKVETVRFCRTLGTLLRSGVSVLQAIQNARDVMGNSVMAASIAGVTKSATEGRGIAAALSSGAVFPTLAVSMIRVGEETGQLDAMLLKVAATYEKSLRTSIKRFVGLVEPVMILGMGLVIGFIVIAMLMGVFSITDLPI